MKKPPLSSTPYLSIQQLASDLRDPVEGCPWDKEQNHKSVIHNLVEETYEVVDTIENLDNSAEAYEKLKEELGDLFFQIVFHSQLANEKKQFNLDDVIRYSLEKLVFRHPHIYGDGESLDSSEKVLTNWEMIKRKEREKKNDTGSMLSGIPGSMPALLKAYRLGQKVARVNFDWIGREGKEQLLAKVLEEYNELLDELPEDTKTYKNPTDESIIAKKERAEEELGDLLFVTAQLARHFSIDPELALQKANKKFQKRFEEMEHHFTERLNRHDHPSVDEWEDAWQNVKAKEKKEKAKKRTS